MLRHLKALCLASVAVFALTAVASASASEFKSENATSTFMHGVQIGSGDVFHTNAGNVTCTSATYAGTQAGASSTTATVAPTYSGCTGFLISATIHMNGCEYKFEEPTVTTAGVTYHGAIEIVCPEGKEITVTAISAGTTKCTIHIPGGQTFANAAEYTLSGSGETRKIVATISISGIHYSQTAGTGFGACTTENNQTNGTYSGEAEMKGWTSSAMSTQQGIWIA
jgi:hypothetical protein